MPGGFPNFRHDPTTEPRYIITTRKPSTIIVGQTSEKRSQNKVPLEREPKKKSNPKPPKGQFEKL
ncbi:hypothetical protein MMC28_003527 [Mycoblastus sanguinarius]|nr:hypothetical protein [Mycoblastus sanguinarius]